MPTYTMHSPAESEERDIAPIGRSMIEQLVAIREDLALLHKQMEAMNQQQSAVYALLAEVLPRPSRGSASQMPANPSGLPAEEVFKQCSRDIVAVLAAAGRPLNLLEILAEMVRRHLSWRENTVKHALTQMLDHGTVKDTSSVRPHSYGLAVRNQ